MIIRRGQTVKPHIRVSPGRVCGGCGCQVSIIGKSYCVRSPVLVRGVITIRLIQKPLERQKANSLPLLFMLLLLLLLSVRLFYRETLLV